MIPGKQPDAVEDDDSTLNVASSTVSYVIERANEAYGGLPSLEDTDGDEAEHRAGEADFQEIADFIDGLNEDARIDLVVLMWIGRGTYGVDELDHARRVALREATHSTSEYLLSTPLVGDYLANGLEAFGMAVEES